MLYLSSDERVPNKRHRMAHSSVPATEIILPIASYYLKCR